MNVAAKNKSNISHDFLLDLNKILEGFSLGQSETSPPGALKRQEPWTEKGERFRNVLHAFMLWNNKVCKPILEEPQNKTASL